MYSQKFCPHGIWGWDGEAYFATVADSAESQPRFGPPGFGSGTPTPGFDLVAGLLPVPVAACRRWLIPAAAGRCWSLPLWWRWVPCCIFRLGWTVLDCCLSLCK